MMTTTTTTTTMMMMMMMMMTTMINICFLFSEFYFIVRVLLKNSVNF
jgi:hypothetical protein